MADLKKVFEGCNVVLTRHIADTAAADMLFYVEMNFALGAHLSGEWGDICAADAALNDEAIKNGSRILSAYKTSKGKIWIITDAADDNGQRYVTTILFPEDY